MYAAKKILTHKKNNGYNKKQERFLASLGGNRLKGGDSQRYFKN